MRPRSDMHSHRVKLDSVYYVRVSLKVDDTLLEFVVRVQTPQLYLRVGRSCCYIRSVRSDLPCHWMEPNVDHAIFMAD